MPFLAWEYFFFRGRERASDGSEAMDGVPLLFVRVCFSFSLVVLLVSCRSLRFVSFRFVERVVRSLFRFVSFGARRRGLEKSEK